MTPGRNLLLLSYQEMQNLIKRRFT